MKVGVQNSSQKIRWTWRPVNAFSKTGLGQKLIPQISKIFPKTWTCLQFERKFFIIKFIYIFFLLGLQNMLGGYIQVGWNPLAQQNYGRKLTLLVLKFPQINPVCLNEVLSSSKTKDTLGRNACKCAGCWYCFLCLLQNKTVVENDPVDP